MASETTKKKSIQKKSEDSNSTNSKSTRNARNKPAIDKGSIQKKPNTEFSSVATAHSPSLNLGANVFIHEKACVVGNVILGDNVSVWPGAVIRADLNRIILGRSVNIQDNTTLHVDLKSPLTIGDYTLVGHNAMLHGCTIGKAALIGIGCIILDGAQIGDGAMITAGCMIRGGMKIPARALVIQKDGQLQVYENKAKILMTIAGSLEYVELAKMHRIQKFDPPSETEMKALETKARAIHSELGFG